MGKSSVKCYPLDRHDMVAALRNPVHCGYLHKISPIRIPLWMGKVLEAHTSWRSYWQSMAAKGWGSLLVSGIGMKSADNYENKDSFLHPKSIHIPFNLYNQHRRHITVLTSTNKKLGNLVTDTIHKVTGRVWISIRLHELQKSITQLGQYTVALV